MSKLAPDFFDRRFDDLVENGRSRLPGLAPAWTDHNVHDPGITLMELLAWNTEAQLYSLARMRRDERLSYAGLLGIMPRGPHPAAGLLWPDRNDAESPAARIRESFVIDRDADVRVAGTDAPLYFPSYRVLWVAAQIVSVQTQLAGGELIDHTATNARGDVAYFPFGTMAGPRDVLRIAFQDTGSAGLFPPRGSRPDDAYLILGVRADAMALAEATSAIRSGTRRVPYSVTMIAGNQRMPLEVVADSTHGFMRTGVCVLRLSSVTGSPSQFTLEFRAEYGYARPPRVLRIEPNVLPVEQAKTIDREVHTGTGVPDQRLALDVPGLRFGDDRFIKVEVAGASFDVWAPCERLSDTGPDDRVYEIDVAQGAIVFGNGLNGAMPPAEAQIYISYGVSEGAAGNAARGKSWIVRGVSGIFGVNPDAISGGTDAFDDGMRRREARRRVREDHALVTPLDIANAALALPDLEVARAFVVPPSAGGAHADIVTLIAMRARGSDASGGDEESPRWLAAVQRRLSRRMTLGSRLVVRAPKYVDFTIRVRADAVDSRDPIAVADEIRSAIGQRLVLVDPGGHGKVRDFGVGLGRRDIAAWIRAVPGVQRITEVSVLDGNGHAVDRLDVPPRGLPRIDLAASSIDVTRRAKGRGA